MIRRAESVTNRFLSIFEAPGPGVSASIAVVGLLVFVLNRNPVTEQDIYVLHYLPYARYLTGDESRDVVTYPMWGYPAVIALLGDALRMVAQFLLALAVAVIVLGRVNRHRPMGRITAATMVAASVPWFAAASLNSATAISVPLVWLAILIVVKDGVGDLKLRTALTTGAMIGLALNFRSEFLVLPAFLSLGLLAWPVIRARSMVPLRKSVVPAFALIVVAWASLLPWAIFSQNNTEDFSVVSTNGGAVSFISLGQLPGNPWGIVHEDAQARRTLDELDHEDVDPYSPEGNEILGALFRDSIRAEPTAFARKMIRNTRNAFIGGLYFGDWEVWHPGTNATRIDVMKEKIKEKIGVNPNLSQIQSYRESGLWDENLDIDEIAIVGLAGLFTAGTNILILTTVVTAVVMLVRRQFTELHGVAMLMLIYTLTLVALLQYQPRHMNPAWPAMVIFIYPLVVALAANISLRLRPRNA